MLYTSFVRKINILIFFQKGKITYIYSYDLSLWVVINFYPTLPCCHFLSHWHGSSWRLSLSLHSEGLERGEMSPGVGGWWCTGHWVCIWQKRNQCPEVHIWKKKMLQNSVEHIYKSHIIVRSAKNKQQVHVSFPPALTLTSSTDVGL